MAQLPHTRELDRRGRCPSSCSSLISRLACSAVAVAVLLCAPSPPPAPSFAPEPSPPSSSGAAVGGPSAAAIARSSLPAGSLVAWVMSSRSKLLAVLARSALAASWPLSPSIAVDRAVGRQRYYPEFDNATTD
eukprot:scaffold3218_cov99-Isochrysis_galbana.AAC.6